MYFLTFELKENVTKYNGYDNQIFTLHGKEIC